MKRTWPIVAVTNVADSSVWYTRLLNAANNHPGASVFDQIIDQDGAVLLCLHHWGPSGLRGDHNLLAPVTIRNNATERGQQKHGYLIGEADSTQQQRRSRQAINQP